MDFGCVTSVFKYFFSGSGRNMSVVILTRENVDRRIRFTGFLILLVECSNLFGKGNDAIFFTFSLTFRESEGLGTRLLCNRSDKTECVADQACISGAAGMRCYM